MKCDYCGKEFKPVNKQHIYCLPSCRYKNQLKVKKERSEKNRKKKKIKCGICEQYFTPDVPQQLYCGDKCKEIARQKQREKNYTKRRAKEKISIILNDGSIDPYYLTRHGGKK